MFWSTNQRDFSDDDFYDSKYTIDLDEFGFPAIALANELLVAQDDFGNNSEQLTENWQDWLELNPFDGEVATKLVRIYQTRISKLDPKKDATEIHRINRKLRLAQGRAERYSLNGDKP